MTNSPNLSKRCTKMQTLTTFLYIHTQVKHFGLTQIKVATNHLTCNIYALEFILNNTYIKFGQQLFLQTKGIHMGGSASPLIADLYLSWLEYQYLSKLVRNKDFNLLHKLKYNSRYIDDIITPNVENFLEIAKHIYPTEIPL